MNYSLRQFVEFPDNYSIEQARQDGGDLAKKIDESLDKLNHETEIERKLQISRDIEQSLLELKQKASDKRTYQWYSWYYHATLSMDIELLRRLIQEEQNLRHQTSG